MEESVINIDGSYPKYRTVLGSSKFLHPETMESLIVDQSVPNLPMPIIIEELVEDRVAKYLPPKRVCKYLDSFCLGCRTRSLNAASIIHNFDKEGNKLHPVCEDFCGGAIVLVSKPFVRVIEPNSKYPEDTASKYLAKRKVDEEIAKMTCDENYLQKLRGQYAKINHNWKEK